MLHLLARLYFQLTSTKLPTSIRGDDDEELEASQLLREAAKGVKALLVLDDVWAAAHLDQLNCVDGSSGSACVVTTRIHHLADEEVACGLLSMQESLSLLLTSGGMDHLIDDPPAAASAAVEACGRLALALPIAGGMIRDLGADCWEAELLPLLEEELADELSLEERLVNASLRCVDKAQRAGVESLFTVFGCFAEDEAVPAAALDTLAPLVCERAGMATEKKPKLRLRRWLAHLLNASLLSRSSDGGIHVHDLIRDVMISRAEASAGGMLALQRAVLALFLADHDEQSAKEASGKEASSRPGGVGELSKIFIVRTLRHHVACSQQPGVALHHDRLLMRVLTHKGAEIRKQAALGVGMTTLRAAADACDASTEHLEAAQLMLAACAERDGAAGAEAKRAWSSLKLLEGAGGGSSESHMLELRALNILFMATEGGFAVGSEEHTSAMARMKTLARARGAALPSQELMEVEVSLGIACIVPAFSLDGISDYPGPMTRETTVQAFGHYCEWAKHMANAAAAAPDEATSLVWWANFALPVLMCPRQHALVEFNPVAECGEGGARLRQTIER